MKKVLIITYYWPPSGGSGVQRWLKFAKYLPEFGWQPIIFTPENPDFDIKDESLMKDVSPDIEVIKIPIWEPYGTFRRLKGEKDNRNINQGQIKEKKKRSFLDHIAIWIRGNLFIPDPRIFWVKPAYKFLKKYLQENEVDVVVTTGPPHSMHLIGLRLKKKFQEKMKWVVDLRDPWSEWDMLEKYQVSRLSKNIHQKLEWKVLQNADKVITVSENWAHMFSKIGDRPVEVITNGFDQSDFNATANRKIPDKFRISHIGLINQLRDPQLLWEVLAELCIENEAFSHDLEIFFAGVISDEIISFFKNHPVLSQKVQFGGYMSHQQVLEEYEKAFVLLLILNNSENALGHIPGKIFEYLASGAWVLALGPEKGDAAKIISTAQVGQTQHAKNKEGIKKAVLDFYNQYNAQKLSNRKDILAYERKNLSHKLSESIAEY